MADFFNAFGRLGDSYGCRSRIGNPGVGGSAFVMPVGVLLLPQVVSGTHALEWLLHVESTDHDRIHLTMVVVENRRRAVIPRRRLGGIFGKPSAFCSGPSRWLPD